MFSFIFSLIVFLFCAICKRTASPIQSLSDTTETAVHSQQLPLRSYKTPHTCLFFLKTTESFPSTSSFQHPPKHLSSPWLQQDVDHSKPGRPDRQPGMLHHRLHRARLRRATLTRLRRPRSHRSTLRPGARR